MYLAQLRHLLKLTHLAPEVVARLADSSSAVLEKMMRRA
jgi:hypothetical protein